MALEVTHEVLGMNLGALHMKECVPTLLAPGSQSIHGQVHIPHYA